MSIQTIGGFNQLMTGQNAKDWTNSVEFGQKVKLDNVDQTMGTSPDGLAATQSFGDFLANSLSKVNQIQQQANVSMEKLASGQSKNLHETMIAVEKAEIAFKQMNQIRQKVIGAYKEVMNMQM
jgi:flagellar hook-basal body complex protein FliE